MCVEMLYNTLSCPIARCNTFLTVLNKTKPAEIWRELIITYSISLTGTLSRGRSYSRLSGVEYIADSTAHTLAATSIPSDHNDGTVSENEYSYGDSAADDEGDNSSVYHSSNEDVDSVHNSCTFYSIYGSCTETDALRQGCLLHMKLSYYIIPQKCFLC